jgi:UDP-N-acetylglucosamine acyltransferase
MVAEGIHPTAIIDPRAELGPGVSVGAYSVIGSDVALGAGCQVGHHVVLEGAVSVGERCRIGHGTIIGGAPQDLKYREGTPSGVRIGAQTVIREYVTIHRATRENGWTQIGEHCLVMAMSHVAHDCVIGNHVIIINYAGITGHVRVEDRATVGGLSGIHPFARIGAYAYIGGCSKVNQDVPPFVIVDGVPATARSVNVIGLRRGGVGTEDRRLIQAAFSILYRSGLAPGAAIGRIKADLPPNPLITRLVEFVETSKLGIVGAHRPAAGSELAETEEERIF